VRASGTACACLLNARYSMNGFVVATHNIVLYVLCIYTGICVVCVPVECKVY